MCMCMCVCACVYRSESELPVFYIFNYTSEENHAWCVYVTCLIYKIGLESWYHGSKTSLSSLMK